MNTPNASVLSVHNLRVGLSREQQNIELVRGVSFDLHPGEILGVVGESGSGKSLTSYSLVGLLEPPLSILDGHILFEDEDLTQLSEHNLRAIRGDKISFIFQDPMVALNPVLTIGEQMAEAIFSHARVSTDDVRKRSIQAMQAVGIPSPAERLNSYPHEFSGGMRQRVVIAIAFLNQPEIIIADEPTTALDVTIQAQIIAEMQDMVQARNTAVIWVTHDLALLSGFADRIAVMYAGEVVELGDAAQVINAPQHPYTKALIEALPVEGREELTVLEGFPPNLMENFKGCAFAPRCPQAKAKCKQVEAPVISDELSYIRCHFPLGGAS
ncbi:dipeptide transport ATP-binding protein DppD (plasmid) [Maritalea myrionectae]|uniref:Dipeptide transport ATP-binding protein DppD n=1 Tax=Maritalea myrionectae TaxID=454601 RepID=A0A2R4MJ86_9HYPH|nr:ABC transporter ATP-binding protein [Maritalea myrionectae]AVX06063.1 dipeptide transport ATP-binding protein DppD [Maritalea myrionectae]